MKRLLGIAALTCMGASPAPQPIAMTVSSWGLTIASWRISPDGAIHYEETGARPGRDPTPEGHVVRDTPPSPARYAWVARKLAPARAWAGKELPCSRSETDAGYGQLRWGEESGGAVLDYNAGCFDAPTKAVLNSAFEVGAQVAEWAKAEPADRR